MTSEKPEKTEKEEKKPEKEKAEKKEMKEEVKETKTEEKRPEEKKEIKVEEKSGEKKKEPEKEKKEGAKETKEEKKGKKPEAPKVPKKEEAVARGVNIHVSTKQCKYICKFIKNKAIDQAIVDLQSVINLKKAVPFKGEIPHRKGKGMMSGRYPVKASKLFINLLKSLKGNVIVNSMDLDNTKIHIASASLASRPMKTGGREAKRTNVTLKAKEVKLKEPKTEKGEKK